MSSFRDRFLVPTNQDVGASRVNGRSSSSLPVCFRPFKRLLPPSGEDPCIYFCGNSLGLLPQSAEALVQQELRVWGSRQASLMAVLIANFFTFAGLSRAIMIIHMEGNGLTSLITSTPFSLSF